MNCTKNNTLEIHTNKKNIKNNNNYASLQIKQFQRGIAEFLVGLTIPVQLAINSWLLYLQLGYSALIGVAFLLLLVPISMQIGKSYCTNPLYK